MKFSYNLDLTTPGVFATEPNIESSTVCAGVATEIFCLFLRAASVSTGLPNVASAVLDTVAHPSVGVAI